MNNESCKVTVVHTEKVDAVKKQLQQHDFFLLSSLGKCLSDSSRLKLLYALELNEEMCVCDLAAVIDASIASASHHLRFLKEQGMTKSHRKGKMIYYFLASKAVRDFIHSFKTLSEKQEYLSL